MFQWKVCDTNINSPVVAALTGCYSIQFRRTQNFDRELRIRKDFVAVSSGTYGNNEKDDAFASTNRDTLSCRCFARSIIRNSFRDFYERQRDNAFHCKFHAAITRTMLEQNVCGGEDEGGIR